MKLYKFRAKHFRCLYGSDWIVIRNPTVLIGCNDGGKTATIQALSHFFGNTPPPLDAYSYVPGSLPDSEGVRPREKEITLEAVFELSSQEVELLRDVLLAPPTEHACLRKVFRGDENSMSFEMLTRVPQNPDLPADPSSLNINEIREYISKLGIPNPGGSQRDPLLAALTQWLQQQPMKDDWAPVPRKVIDILPLYQVVEGKDPESTIFQMLNVAHRQLLKQTDTQKLLGEFEEQVDALLRQPLEAKIASLSGYITKYLPDITQAYVNPQFTVNAGLQSVLLVLC